MQGLISFVLIGSVVLTLAEVLDLGQLDRYNPRIQNASNLGGTTVWVSGKEGDGFDIQLSPDAKAKIQGVFDGCGTSDNDCYQGARNILRSADLQIDGALERRGFAQLLSKTFKSVADMFLEISAILYSQWKLRNQETRESGLFLPQQDAHKASALASATAVVISAQGSGVGTVTPTPDPTKLQGAQTPAVTQVTQPSDGFSNGDLAAILDVDLARRINDLMHMMLHCEDGVKFDASNSARRKKRAGGTYGQAICGAEAVASMAGPGGPFNDLLLINPTAMPFGFADGAGEAARAAGIVGDFVLAYAPMLTIGEELAHQLATYLIALAIDTVVENIPLKGQNRIASSLVTTATPTTSTRTTSRTGCPDPTKTPLLCGYPYAGVDDCDVKLPDKIDEDPVCASGDLKDCVCNAPPGANFDILTADQVTFIMDVRNAMHSAVVSLPDPGTSGPLAKCRSGNFSNIPSNVFGSASNNVYGRFCEGWVADQERKMTVDAAGNDRLVKSNPRRRTPPPNPGTWSHYNFGLSFTPTDKSKKCALDCKDAYTRIKNGCSSAGTKNTPMAKGGKLDVSCGLFEYKIEGPTTPLMLQERHCYASDAFGQHGDIQKSWQAEYTGWTCTGTALKTIKRDDPSTNIHWETMTNDVPYQYNIYWKDGCLLDFDPGYNEIYPANPLSIQNPSHTACQQLLIDNYQKCNNGGAGGSIQVGCLVYEFKAQKSLRGQKRSYFL